MAEQTESREKRWTSAEWIVVLGVIFSGVIGVVNSYQGKGRDTTLDHQSTTLDTIKHNTNSSLTELKEETKGQRAEIKAMRAEMSAMQIQKATDDERETPTSRDGSAK